MAPSIVDGIIEADKAYSIKVFQRITGMGTAAMREARKKGLPVRRCGLRSFVIGRDWIEYLAENSKIVE